MPIGPARMPLMDHLGELRRRLMIIVVSTFLTACVLYFFAPAIAQFLMAPISKYLSSNNSLFEQLGLSQTLFVSAPLEAFTIRFKIGFFAAVIVCEPIILWECLAFFLPALKPNERKWVVPTVAVGVGLFVVGTVFCYYCILDPAFAWLLDQATGMAVVFAGASEYLNLIMLFEIGFGIAFELPLIVFYLIIFNVIPYKKLRSSWRTVYIVLMVICACVTPDASPVTMLLMFAAMAGLYELSLAVSRVVLGRKIKAQSMQDMDAAAEAAAKAGIKIKDVAHTDDYVGDDDDDDAESEEGSEEDGESESEDEGEDETVEDEDEEEAPRRHGLFKSRK